MRSRSWSWPCLVATASVLTVAVPRVADACSPLFGVSRTTPEDGESLPAGSQLLLQGFFDEDMLHLRVDGEPASLVRDSSFPGQTGQRIAYRVEPAPAVGSTVTLYECDAPELDQCSDPPSWSWPVSDADQTPPATADELEFGIYDHTDVDTSGDTCSSGELLDMTIYVHTTAPAEDGTGAPRKVLVEILDADQRAVLGERLLSVPVTGGMLDTQLSFTEGVIGSPLAESTCVQVTVVDMAGLAAEPLVSCMADHVGADPDQGPGTDIFPPDEPQWDELVDPDAPRRDTCACRTDASGGSLAPLLLVLGMVLGLGSRRRR